MTFKRKPEKHKLKKLAQRAQKGNAEAFGQIYDQLHNQVYAYVLRQVRSRTDAEDIVAEIFLSAWRNMDRFDWKDAGLEPWLFRIARNSVIDHFRRVGRSRESGLGEEIKERASGETVEDAAETAWRQRELLAAIDRLSDEQRQVVLLRLVANLSSRQIGEVLEKSEGAVKALQYRALTNLRDILEHENDEKYEKEK
ncbi:MAG: sigma-70 family RNA polymerase sigma factor [Thermoleophilia bacterium]|nr:sigma-70 family RNA polymerase sigma factor [Thermoleophilia bacterium]